MEKWEEGLDEVEEGVKTGLTIMRPSPHYPLTLACKSGENVVAKICICIFGPNGHGVCGVAAVEGLGAYDGGDVPFGVGDDFAVSHPLNSITIRCCAVALGSLALNNF